VLRIRHPPDDQGLFDAVTQLNLTATRDEVVDLLNRHALTSLPVVDFEGQVLGIVPFDSLVRAAQAAATDDLQQMVGAGKDERARTFYLDDVRLTPAKTAAP